MAKGKLSDEVKSFIVQALACFDAPTVVAEAVKKRFGSTISRQLVENYDPYKLAGRAVSDRWRILFDATRKAFLEDSTKIAITHKTMRLRALQRMCEKTEEQGNIALTAGENGATFVLGSAVPHDHPLHLGYYSVHTTAEALEKGERRIEELAERLRSEGAARNSSGSVPVFR